MFTIYINYVNITEPLTQKHPQARPARHCYLIQHDFDALDETYAFLDRVKQRAFANANILIVDYSIYTRNPLKLYDTRYIAPAAQYSEF